jgi:hypothetical protein
VNLSLLSNYLNFLTEMKVVIYSMRPSATYSEHFRLHYLGWTISTVVIGQYEHFGTNHGDTVRGFYDATTPVGISLCLIGDLRCRRNLRDGRLEEAFLTGSADRRIICICGLLSMIFIIFWFITHIKYRALNLSLLIAFALHLFILLKRGVFIYHFTIFLYFPIPKYRHSNVVER